MKIEDITQNNSDLLGTKYIDRMHTTVTYSCGHNTDFIESPPEVGDWIVCRNCFKDVHVVKSVSKGRQGAPRKRIKTGGRPSKQEPKENKENDDD